MNPAALTPLAAIPSPSQSVWHLGPVPIRAYALCIVLGIVAACAVTEVRMRRRGAPPWAVLDIAVWAVPFGIVGARIYHVVTSPAAYFGTGGRPLDAFLIWQGGLGIWGGVAGGALGAWIAARRLGIPLWFVADALAPGLPLAQGIGRWGNWFNNELYGRPTTLPWGLQVHEWDIVSGRAQVDGAGHPLLLSGLYHPTFLYESLWDVGTALLVWLLDRRYRFGRGRAFALYVMAYTAGRFWIEAVRMDEATHILGMRINNWTSIVVFLGALIYFVRVRGARQRLVTDADGTLRAVGWDDSDGSDGSGGSGGEPADGVGGGGAGAAVPADATAEPADATVEPADATAEPADAAPVDPPGPADEGPDAVTGRGEPPAGDAGGQISDPTAAVPAPDPTAPTTDRPANR